MAGHFASYEVLRYVWQTHSTYLDVVKFSDSSYYPVLTVAAPETRFNGTPTCSKLIACLRETNSDHDLLRLLEGAPSANCFSSMPACVPKGALLYKALDDLQPQQKLCLAEFVNDNQLCMRLFTVAVGYPLADLLKMEDYICEDELSYL